MIHIVGLVAVLLAAELKPSAINDHRIALEITGDTVFDPAKLYGPIVIKTSGITVDGQGAAVVGNSSGDPKTFREVGITAQGVSNVTLRNVRVKGWETGLRLQDCASWTIENCDFSDNFHDPEFGWGENGRRGGIVLEQVARSTLRKNRANRVWDACSLINSKENTLVENDFSHTSDTGLKLWTASRNRVLKNNISYGLRIKPGEVHARDSTCVLIESGSNDNVFEDNDCTHGGDGIFVRVLNGWVSTGNRFERNDCSYANNNGFEAWSPRNLYRSNKANWCSYGFWLGASDQTVLIGNEASHNGDPRGFHNSPHLPGNGHAGIVFMFGPSSHTIVRGNTCVGNQGAGIALVGDESSQGRKWKAFHWIIEGNTLAKNRWGIFARQADWIDLADNRYRDNREGKFYRDNSVSNVFEHPRIAGVHEPPMIVLRGPSSARVGDLVTLDASESRSHGGGMLQFRWDLGDGTVLTNTRIAHRFAKAGFYRVGLTVNDGSRSNLAWRDLYVVAPVQELGTEGEASHWSWHDPDSKAVFHDDQTVRIAGKTSIAAVVRPYGGGRVNLVYPRAKDAYWALAGKRQLVFWIKTLNENVPAWQGPNPLVTLQGREGRVLRLTPKTDWLAQPPYNEAREGWTYFAVPLHGNDDWSREGVEPTHIQAISLGFDSWGAPPLRIWIDGLAFE